MQHRTFIKVIILLILAAMVSVALAQWAEGNLTGAEAGGVAGTIIIVALVYNERKDPPEPRK
jgi:hypothetical protein